MLQFIIKLSPGSLGESCTYLTLLLVGTVIYYDELYTLSKNLVTVFSSKIVDKRTHGLFA
jgi:hypothetical protein